MRYSLLRLIPIVIPPAIIATPTAAIMLPFTAHSGFLYMKELSGPTRDWLCAINSIPNAMIIEPIMITALDKFIQSGIDRCRYNLLVRRDMRYRNSSALAGTFRPIKIF